MRQRIDPVGDGAGAKADDEIAGLRQRRDGLDQTFLAIDGQHVGVAMAAQARRQFIALVTPVYSAGEVPIPGIDRDELASGLRRHGHPNVLTVDGEEGLVETVAALAQPGDLVVGLGAGTITDWINALPQKLSDHGARA